MIARLSLLLAALIALAGCGALPSPDPLAQTPTLPDATLSTPTPSPMARTQPATPTTLATTTPTAEPEPTPSVTPSPRATATAVPSLAPEYSYPIAWPGRAPGDGFFIRHGYAVENTWFNPNYWHTGEDWYALDADTAGAAIYAIAAGEVVYVGANYPGRVVIVQHRADLFSMYGHLDPNVTVQTGQQVERGALLGTVLRRSDNVPNHLHFEVRTFLTAGEVNGAAPRYGFRCGVNCPPGPGYWPIAAPDHPSEQGWRNPTHLIAQRAFPAEATGTLGEAVVVSAPISSSLTLWSAPPTSAEQAQSLGELRLQPGARFSLLAIQAGPEDSRATGANAYQLWYEVALDDGRRAWLHAAVASDFETGNDGRPSTVRFNLVPWLATETGG